MTKIKIGKDKVKRIQRLTKEMLFNELKAVRDNRLKEKRLAWTPKSHQPYPNALKSHEVAELMNYYFSIILFDTDKPKLSIYVQEKGVYLQDHTLIRYYISKIEKEYTLRDANDVIFQLVNMALDVGVYRRLPETHILPFKNGLYDNRKKELMDYSPEYVFVEVINTDHQSDTDLFS